MSASTLITDVNVFDGANEKLIKNVNVRIDGNKIKTVSSKKITADGATVIDGGGRTLMPGLIDAHYHPAFAAIPLAQCLSAEIGYITHVAAKNGELLLIARVYFGQRGERQFLQLEKSHRRRTLRRPPNLPNGANDQSDFGSC